MNAGKPWRAARAVQRCTSNNCEQPVNDFAHTLFTTESGGKVVQNNRFTARQRRHNLGSFLDRTVAAQPPETDG
jgi:hypothetical protein